MDTLPHLPPHPSRRIGFDRTLLAILVVSVVVRVLASLYLGNEVQNLPGTADQLSYHTLAMRVLEGHGFSFGEPWWPATRAGAPTAHWSYLYTFYLVLVYAVFGAVPLVARILQSLIVGLLLPWLAYEIGWKLFGRSAGLAVAGLTAIYAYFVYYAAALMTESFYLVSVLAVLHFSLGLAEASHDGAPSSLRRWRAIALGLSLAAAVLLRQVFLPVIPFLYAWILWTTRGRVSLRTTLTDLGLSALLLLASLAPFTLYNSVRFGHLVGLNTNAGFAFFWANHPIHGTSFQPILSDDAPSYGSLIPEELRGLDESLLDRALLLRGLEFVRDDPLRYMRLSLSRIPAYFMFWPSRTSSAMSNFFRVASFGLLWPVMLVGMAIALVRKPMRHPGTVLLLGFAIVYTSIHLLSWALIRYRLPVDAVLLIFAGLGVTELASALLRWWRNVKLRDRRPDPWGLTLE